MTDRSDWVRDSQYVHVFSAHDRRTPMSAGWVQSYCDAPTVGLLGPDGSWTNWRADLCKPADPPPGVTLDQARLLRDTPKPTFEDLLGEIRDELRRLNEGRDSFHREVLEVLTRSSEGPSGAGATAQVVEEPPKCGSQADLATTDMGASVWFTCVLDRGHADFHSDGRGTEWLSGSQQEGEDR